MNIKFYTNGNKPINKLYVRVYHSNLDVCAFTGLFVDSNWDSNSQSLANNSDFNIKISELRTSILTDLNKAFASGDIINRLWLETVIKETFERPKHEIGFKNKNHEIYLTDFADYWIENFADKWKVGPRKLMTKKVKGQYQKVSDDLKEFELSSEKKITLKDLNAEVFDEIIIWLEDLNYQPSTISRFIKRIKFLCARAIQCGYSVSKNYNDKVFVEKEEELDGIYLNEDEIQKVFNLDLSHDNQLDNIRDNLIISCWTGLRVSDFMYNLKTDNIKNGFISIKTQKTGVFVKLPIHKMIKSILEKRFGQLPEKTTYGTYNKGIKTICMLSNIDELIYGKLWDDDKKRKVLNYRPKWNYVSTHIGRKSLASNLAGKVSNEIIKSVCGWTNDSLAEFYNKTSKTDYAKQLEKIWSNQ